MGIIANFCSWSKPQSVPAKVVVMSVHKFFRKLMNSGPTADGVVRLRLTQNGPPQICCGARSQRSRGIAGVRSVPSPRGATFSISKGADTGPAYGNVFRLPSKYRIRKSHKQPPKLG